MRHTQYTRKQLATDFGWRLIVNIFKIVEMLGRFSEAEQHKDLPVLAKHFVRRRTFYPSHCAGGIATMCLVMRGAR